MDWCFDREIDNCRIWIHSYFCYLLWYPSYFENIFFCHNKGVTIERTSLSKETYTVKHPRKIFPSCDVFRGVDTHVYHIRVFLNSVTSARVNFNNLQNIDYKIWIRERETLDREGAMNWKWTWIRKVYVGIYSRAKELVVFFFSYYELPHIFDSLIKNL